MCSRYAITTAPEALRASFGYVDLPNFPPRYNIAPTQPVPVIICDHGIRHFTLMRWGFMPSWVKEPKDYPLIFNIRAETAREKPSFRAAFLRRRALMPADAFYEWQREGRVSTPWMIRSTDGAPFAFPALWETWEGPEGSAVDTVALITTASQAPLATIHPRSPVILNRALWSEWLDPETKTERAEAMLTAPSADSIVLSRISKAVNKAANDGPEVQEPYRETAEPPPAPKSRKVGDSGQGSLF
ncbi:SOS response-associated peptidase [Phreatobacter aquaticus]|uniref:Abasic site processing protein n=1 Tax=Phreatobacter aquaticus TaxID=2570229 RepID=A0A4D7QQ79_9HYPH|nr:SOS response-associated peptidase [Phreatobacter aquaticus]QCK86272.1 SOS response-associated peptidase [Phreatobacter aquaticus]